VVRLKAEDWRSRQR